MLRQYDRQLILADGTVYRGFGFGAQKESIVEVVFNTSMVGYQEILTDPSYKYQGVVMTYPLIGNYGINRDDGEREYPSLGALIVRDYCEEPSNFRAEKTLGEEMKQWGIPGLCGIDTRKLTRQIRTIGSCLGLICDIAVCPEEGVEKIRTAKWPRDAVSQVSRPEQKHFYSSRPAAQALRVTAIDCGMKQGIVRSLNQRGCDVTVLPYNTDLDTVLAQNPHGLFISNGPGDPEDVPQVAELIRQARGRLPIFGICLGSQLIAHAYGAKTYKLKFGHRGGNHPVKNLCTGKIEMTSQNHSYAVDEETLAGTGLAVTHRNLLDGTVEGIACAQDKIFGIQYHPESAPGPQDSAYLFDQFIAMMKEEM